MRFYPEKIRTKIVGPVLKNKVFLLNHGKKYCIYYSYDVS